MIYRETKTKGGYKYENEDVYGSIKIWSEKKLEGEMLDILLLDNIIPKKLKTGKYGTTRWEAEFKNDWEEIEEEIEFKREKDIRDEKKSEVKKKSWIRKLLNKLKFKK